MGAKWGGVGKFGEFFPQMEKIMATNPQIGANLGWGRKIVGANAPPSSAPLKIYKY